MSIQADQYQDYVILEWWNSCDIKSGNGNYILYQTGFQQKLYLECDVGKPTYQLVEEGKETGDKTFVPTFQRWEKQYTFKMVVYEYMADALSIIPIHDNIWVTLQNNERSRVLDMTVSDPVWSECGCTAEIDITFTIDYIAKGNCCENLVLINLNEGVDENGNIIDITPSTFTVFPVVATEVIIQVQGQTGYKIQIDWGDGSIQTESLSATTNNISHLYLTATSHVIRIGRNIDRITYFNITDEGNVYCLALNVSESMTRVTDFTINENDPVTAAQRTMTWNAAANKLESISMINARFAQADDTNFPVDQMTDIALLNLRYCALTAASVDWILYAIDNNSVVTNGILNLDDCYNNPAQCNAAPTNGAVTGYDGITAKANLIAKGWTVNTN